MPDNHSDKLHFNDLLAKPDQPNENIMKCLFVDLTTSAEASKSVRIREINKHREMFIQNPEALHIFSTVAITKPRKHKKIILILLTTDISTEV